MSDFLKQLAMESDLIDDVAGNPEELTVVTDATETELEETISEMAEDVEKAADQTDGAEKMVEIIDSLESKVAMLRDMRSRGVNLNAHAAAIYTKNVIASLESRSFPAGLYATEMNELTHSFESNVAYDYSTEAEEKTEGLIAKTKAMLSKALDAFIRFFKDMMARASGLGKNMIELGGKLIRAAEGMDGKVSQEAEIKTAGLEIVAADPVAAINKLLTASQEVAAQEQILAGAMKTDFVNRVAKSDATNADKQKALTESRSGLKDRIELPGGKALVWADSNNGSMELKADDKFTAGIAKTVKPLSKDQVKSIGEVMVKAGTAMKVSDADQKHLIAKLEAGIGEVAKLAGSEGAKEASVATKEMSRLLNGLRTGRSQLNKHAAVTAKQAYRLASMSANRHVKEKKAEA